MSTISTTAQSNSLSRKISDWAKANSLFLLVVAAFLTFRLLLVLGFGSIGPDIYDYMRSQIATSIPS